MSWGGRGVVVGLCAGLFVACSSTFPETAASATTQQDPAGLGELDDSVAALPPERPAPPPPTAEDPATAAALARRFECANAPEVLGHPGWQVEDCEETPGLPGMFRIKLHHPDEGYHGSILVLDDSGHVITERGPAVAGRYLRRVGAVEAGDLNPALLTMCLSALGGFPPPFGLDDKDFSQRGIGTGSVTAGPLRVELYHLVADRSGRGDPSASTYRRGVLAAGEDGRLAWTIAEGPPWAAVEVVTGE